MPTSIDVSNIAQERDIPSKTYAIDWANGRILGYVDGIEAVKQYIAKALRTPRFKCLIYNDQYGNEIRDLITSADRDYITTEMPFLVKDALIYDDRIIKVYNVEVTFLDDLKIKDSILIEFDVDTIYGTISKEVAY